MVADLYRVPENGKAELIDGQLVLMSPTGGVPGRAAGRIYRSLDDYERTVGGGCAFPDTSDFSSTFLNANPSAPTPPSGSESCRRVGSSFKARRSSRSRSGARTTTDPRPRG